MEATSPTDRIEQLLNKYKARYNLSSAASSSSNNSTPALTPSKGRPFTWQDINKQLRARGFAEIIFTSASRAEDGAAVMEGVSLQSVGATINALLEDFDRKQNLIQQLFNDSSKESEQLKLMKEETDQSRNQVNNLQKQLSALTAKYKELEEVHFLSLKDHAQQMDEIKKEHTKVVSACQELQTKCLNQEAEINHLKNQLATLKLNIDMHTSDTISGSSQRSSPVKKTVVVPTFPDQQLENDFEVLKTQINNLKYKNIKLQLDLQNRPERQELRQTQKRVKQLEQELAQCKTLLSSEQREMHHAQKHLESICAVLDVKDMDHVIPCLQQHQVMLKAMKSMEKCLVAIVDLLAHPNSPAVQHSPTPCHGHMSWCHYSWDHVIPTLKQWLKELNGLKELYAVFADVCNSLKLKGAKHDGSEPFEYSTLSCKQMSLLLRQWLLKDPNKKVAQQQALVTMVTHYQHMFGVKWVGGVYASMSRVAMTLEETQNILKTIKEILHLDHTASGRQLVTMVEQLASNHDNTSLMAQIVEQIGLTSPSEVVERLKLCQRFFPAFQQIISEIQESLGVHSLGAISPALQELQRKAKRS